MILGTKEWAQAKSNCILGCKNDCLYCYAKDTNVRFDKIKREDWHIEHPNKNAKARKYDGKLMFPTSHDLHMDTIGLWGTHLDKLVNLGNDILLVSKAEWDAQKYIIDRYKDTPFASNIEFRYTIGTDDEETRKMWEPGAPSMFERVKCLKYANACGYKTSVSMEPLLMKDPVPFINKIDVYVTGDIWIGIMNYLKESWFQPHNRIWMSVQQEINSKENIEKVYAATKNNPKVKYKDSIRDLLGLE